MKTLILFSVFLWSSSAIATNYKECTSTVSEVLSGPLYQSMIKLEDTSCGNNGWICVHPQSDADKVTSDRVFSSALTAKTTQAPVFVRWRTNANACNGSFPLIYDFRIR
jgi:hypothetical protein